MANHEMPRRGSAPANALVTLHSIGGSATLAVWARARLWKGTISQFELNVIERLIRANLVAVREKNYSVTDDGMAYLGFSKDQPEEAPAEPVPSRYVHPIQPLNLARHRPQRVIRAGAMDFRAAPSLIGGQVVAYKGPGSFSGVAN
jgi:hypothetical protein